ncbi:MAG TPA: type II toxin-antitoxin system VapB family antitoxin [Geminicoccaceae bacterium]|nr:type II toxin-antitoxin system VapB family antitoxin [Geminicoccaceae bacterium]
MRTNIVIDDALMAEAMRLSGLKTKKAMIQAALELFVKIKRQRDIFELAGKIQWEGDLEESRLGRQFK